MKKRFGLISVSLAAAVVLVLLPTILSGSLSRGQVVDGRGAVWAWGWNGYGQLGNGTTNDSMLPVQVTGLTDAVATGGGKEHSLAVKSDGTVWAWGYNGYGQLGHEPGDGDSVTEAGGYYRPNPVQVPGLTGVVSVAGGNLHSLALKGDGTVWAWGFNGYGQLGHDNSTDSVLPNLDRYNPFPTQVAGLTDVVAVSGNCWHSLAVESNGTVWAWGYNDHGQLGDGTTEWRDAPVQVTGLTGITAVSAGFYHSIALKSDGTAWTWGLNERGQLGNGTTTSSLIPVQVSGLTGATTVGAGELHCIALKDEGTVWAWGDNSHGQLGDGSPLYPDPEDPPPGVVPWKTTPAQVIQLTDVVTIAAGGAHNLTVKADGTAWAWGYNASGELGNNSADSSSTPVQVIGLVFAEPLASAAAGQSPFTALAADYGASSAVLISGGFQHSLGIASSSITSPVVTSITPKQAANTGTVTISNLQGANFKPDATVRLERGTTVIKATNVVVSGNTITCKLNLLGKPTGKYDVVVKNSDGQEGRLVGGFSITNACGQGAAASVSVFAGLLGLLSLAGFKRKRRAR